MSDSDFNGSADRQSGVYATHKASTAREIAEAARLIVGRGAIAVVLAPTPTRGTTAAVLSETKVEEDHGFSIALRLASWLTTVDNTSRLEVPAYVAPWLAGAATAIVIPIQTPCWVAGHLVIAADAVSRADGHTLLDLAAGFAAELETADRRSMLESLRTVSPRSASPRAKVA